MHSNGSGNDCFDEPDGFNKIDKYLSYNTENHIYQSSCDHIMIKLYQSSNNYIILFVNKSSWYVLVFLVVIKTSK